MSVVKCSIDCTLSFHRLSLRVQCHLGSVSATSDMLTHISAGYILKIQIL